MCRAEETPHRKKRVEVSCRSTPRVLLCGRSAFSVHLADAASENWAFVQTEVVGFISCHGNTSQLGAESHVRADKSFSLLIPSRFWFEAAESRSVSLEAFGLARDAPEASRLTPFGPVVMKTESACERVFARSEGRKIRYFLY